MKKGTMSYRAILLLTVVLGAASGVSAMDWNADVRLALDEESALPGTPTGITVTIANRGKGDIELPPMLWLVATANDGSSFPLRNLLSRQGKPVSVADEIRIIPANGTKELRFDVPETVQGAQWLLDERIVVPGTYELRAVLTRAMDQSGRFDVATALVSNPVRYTVEVPAGDDAAIWAWMREAARGPWDENAWFNQPGRFAEFVLTNYPDSRYALYAAFWAPCCDVERQNATLRRVIDANQDKVFADQLELALARRHEKQYSVAYARGEIEKAVAEFEMARDLSAKLSWNARSATTRSLAASLVEQLPTKERLLEGAQLRAHDGTRP